MNHNPRILYKEYKIFLSMVLLFIVMAFILDTPADIFQGLTRILTQRGLLITDFMVVGGLGAAIINSAIASIYGVVVLYFMRAKPSGAAIMCLWMTAGWTYWGATVLNILPLTLGVWLYSRFKKTPFSDYVVAALLCHAIAPIVSLFYFSNPIAMHLGVELHVSINIFIGVVVGLFIGFFLPVILATMVRVHDGFTLYNMGVAGGMIAKFVAAIFVGAGIAVPTESMWYTYRQLEIAIFLFVIFAALIITGLILGRAEKTPHAQNIKTLLAHSGHAPNDFYALVGPTMYVNMGLLGAIGTVWALIFGFDLNAGTFACIFSMIAFGSLGKHIRNVLPLLAGATICAAINPAALAAPSNALAVLFSTCLAPIAGKFGFGWGMVAGFLHVLIVTHAGPVTNGLNLYNNGFTSGFVALVLVPIIVALKRKKAGDDGK
ncbi:MAG: DUF1576 domain-containing protein [Oscillospiraceae bacterium]|nr:DUF1576 domain-containing protein [Oscillospiraceae bacterium]